MKGEQFTAGGIILLGFLLWIAGQNGDADLRKMINGLLFVLLMSIVLLRFDKLKPLILKGG